MWRAFKAKHYHYGHSLLPGGTRHLGNNGRGRGLRRRGWSLDEGACGTPLSQTRGNWYEGRKTSITRNPGLRTRRATIRTADYRYGLLAKRHGAAIRHKAPIPTH